MQSEAQQLSLVGLLRLLLNAKWLVLGATLVGLLAGASAYALLAKRYEAVATLIPASNEEEGLGLAGLAGQLGGLASLAGVSVGGGGADTVSALATLRSRRFLLGFVRRHDIAKLLFPDHVDATTGDWLEAEEPTDNELFDEFRKRISISEDKVTQIITLRVVHTEPELTARWCQWLINDLNLEIRQRVISEANKSVEFLRNELSGTQIVDVQKSIFELIEGQIQRRMLANVREEYALKVIDPPWPADADDPVFPKLLIMLIAGLLLGFGFSVCWVLVRSLDL